MWPGRTSFKTGVFSKCMGLAKEQRGANRHSAFTGPRRVGTVPGMVSSFTLCTIPDESRALREIYRVLRPGGSLHFVEHGLSPDAGVTKWQHRIEPFNRKLFGGCHLTRAHDDALLAAGFVIDRLDKSYTKGPKPYTFHYIGTARKPLPSA